MKSPELDTAEPSRDGRLCWGNFLPAAALPAPIAFSHRTSPPRTCEDLLRSSRAVAVLASQSQFSPRRSPARPCPSPRMGRGERCSRRSGLWPHRMRRPSQLRETSLPTPPVLPQAPNTSSSHSPIETPSPLGADSEAFFALAAFSWLSTEGLLRALTWMSARAGTGRDGETCCCWLPWQQGLGFGGVWDVSTRGREPLPAAVCTGRTAGTRQDRLWLSAPRAAISSPSLPLTP